MGDNGKTGMKKTVLITGCSSGFGKLAVKKFSAEGWNVVATMRSPHKETQLNDLDNVFVTRLDVTDMDSIKSAVENTLEHFGSIDVLVNNAGYGGYGLFEQFSDAAIRAMFDTNVFGLMNVTREVLPFLRKQKSGGIINITSLVGIYGPPATSIYSATKFAVNGFTEALAQELKPLNVFAKTVAPGAFDTNFSSAVDVNFGKGDADLLAHGKRVGEDMARAKESLKDPNGPAADPQDVADLIFKCATEETPVHNLVGKDTEHIANMRKNMKDEDFLNAMIELVFKKEV